MKFLTFWNRKETDIQTSLALDEVIIEGGEMFDPQTKQHLGTITLPPDVQGTVF